MTSLNKWCDLEAKKIIDDYKKNGINEDIALRTYSARLLGSDPELVLHGGGNTSVKTKTNSLFGEDIKVLCVKGSGWDLATIEPEGHPAVKLEPLLKLKNLKALSDEDMVSVQRQNLINPKSPNPSVETLLHAFLPHKFIDHTHSISILSLADQENSEEICKKTFGNEVAIVPYIMPGFDLAKLASEIHEDALRKANNNNCELKGMILLKHGVFSFGRTAKESYSRMIEIVKKAEDIIPRKVNLNFGASDNEIKQNDLYGILPFLRGLISKKFVEYGGMKKCIFEVRLNKKIQELTELKNFKELSIKGVATPDHVIRTKSQPLILDPIPENFNLDSIDLNDYSNWIENTKYKLNKYIENYQIYFRDNNSKVGNIKKILDPIPRIIFIPKYGMISIGSSKKASKIVADIGESWIETLLSAESFGKYKPVNEKDTFDLEYWSLEQAKLGKNKLPKLSGNITLVTGAGGTIGSEIAKVFHKNGAEVICLDKDFQSAKRTAELCGKNALALKCDVSDRNEVKKAFKKIVLEFGGFDILVSNAGIALEGKMDSLDDLIFDKSLKINLLSHHYLCQESLLVFRKQDFDKNNGSILGGQFLFNVSKQALNPGKGFGAYGISKSALLALMKQYALEEGENNIRSNCINADRIRSGLLNNEMIQSRSIARGLTEEQYLSGNLLKSEVRAKDVAEAFLSLSLMQKTTGAILTVDGGNVAAMTR